MYILMMFPIILIGIYFLCRPKYALFTYLVFAPFSYYYAYLSDNPAWFGDLLQKGTRDFLVLLFYFIYLLNMFAKGKIPKLRSLSIFFILLFGGLMLLQYFGGILENHWISAMGLRNALEFVPLVFIVPALLSKKEDIRKIFNALFVVAFIVALLGLYQSFVLGIGVPSRIAVNITVHRIFSTLFSPNNLGAYLTIFGLLLFNYMLDKHYLINWPLSFIILSTLLVCLFFTYSRSALFGFIIGAGYLTIIKHKKIFWGGAGVLSIIMILLLLFNPSSLGRYFITIGDPLSDRSLLGRYLHIFDFMQFVSARPSILLTGAGINETSTMVYELGEGVVSKSGIGTDNYYLFLLATGGPILLFVFCAIIYSLFKEVNIMYLASDDIYFKTLARGVKAVLVTFVFMGLFSNIWGLFPSNMYFWFLIGLLFAIKRNILLSKQ